MHDRLMDDCRVLSHLLISNSRLLLLSPSLATVLADVSRRKVLPAATRVTLLPRALLPLVSFSC